MANNSAKNSIKLSLPKDALNKLPNASQNKLSVDITIPPPPPPPPSPPEEVSIRKETPKQENRVKTRLLKSPRNQTATQKSTREKGEC